jgi:hypothetical protein
MPNITKILSPLEELLARLPAGSKAAREAIAAEIAAQDAAQKAAYAPHTLPTETGATSLEQAKKTLGKADGGAINLDDMVQKAFQANAQKMATGGKTRAGTKAQPFPWEDALEEQLGRTTARFKGFMNEPEEELKRMVYQYLPAPTDSPEEKERKLNELGINFSGTIGKAPRMSKAQAIESGLYHPVGAGKKLARPVSEVEFTRVPDPNMPMAPRKVITPEDLYKKQGYPVPWDASAAGELLTGMGGKLFEEPVVLQGGVGYQRTHGGAHSPQKLAVASQPGIISRHSNIIKRIASEGDDPVSVVLAMSPGHGLDYNKMLANTLVQQLKTAKIPSKLAKEFDEEVRAAHPDFVGVKSKKLEEQLNADTSGELRKTFAKRMMLDQFQKGGFPDVVESRVAISTPEMLNAPVGSGGMSFGLMDPAGGVVKEAVNPHHTYKASSPGEYFGGMDVNFSAEELFPAFHEQRRLLSADPKDDWYAFGRTIPAQKFDQEWLDKIMPLYEQRMKELTGKKEGGMAVGGVPEKRDVSQLFPINPNIGREPVTRNRAGVPVQDTNVLGGAMQGLGETLLGAGRGYTATALGGVQDLLNMVDIPKIMTGESYQIPYGSEYFKENLPLKPTTQTGEVAQELGSFLPVDPTQVVKSGVKTAKNIGKAIAPTAAEMALDIASKYGVDPRMNIIKPKSGNWLNNSVEESTKRVKRYNAPPINREAELLAEIEEATKLNDAGYLNAATMDMQQLRIDMAADKWVEKKLNPYIKNEMGTETDPIRLGIERRAAEGEKLKQVNQARLAKMEADIAKAKAAGKDTTLSEGDLEKAREKFADEEYIATQGLFHKTIPEAGWAEPPPAQPYLTNRRKREGMPLEDIASHPAAKRWERAVDMEIEPIKAARYQEDQDILNKNPYLSKIAPDSSVYNVDPVADATFEFRHMMDEIKEAMNPQTVLPKSLRISPKDLEKMTVDDVSALSGKISAWRDVQKTKTDLQVANNPATHTFKEYPSENNPKGVSWRQIKKPEGYPKEEAEKFVRDATKYEGDIMRHCVGGAGHCEPLLRGDVEIYTLRDAKGEPHVTIEVQPPKKYTEDDVYEQFPGGVRDAAKSKTLNQYIESKLAELNNKPSKILEIKGKNNRKPNPEYIPFVQDFIKSGNWSEIRDLHHTDLYDVAHHSLKDFIPQSFDASASDRMIAIAAARRNGELMKGLMTREEWEPIVQKYLPQKKAQGGAVHMAEGGAVNLDDIVAKAFMRSQPINLDEIVSQAFTKNFAEGGAAYNTTPDMADGGQFIQGEAF